MLSRREKIHIMGMVMTGLIFADTSLAAEIGEEEKVGVRVQGYSLLQEEAWRRINLAKAYTSPQQEIPVNLRSMFDPTANEMQEKRSLGGGMIRGFKVGEETYVIWGNRFGKAAKLSVGGSVERTDKAFVDTICRELDEEYFHQLPLSSQHYYLKETLCEGGFQVHYDSEGGQTISIGPYGPYLTFFVVDSGYTLGDLQSAVCIMNKNARLHYPVATLFEKLEEGFISLPEAGSEAADLLRKFKAAIDQEGDAIVPLCPEANELLGKMIQNPDARPAEGWKGFAKKYIHVYTEFSGFSLERLNDYFKLDIPRFHKPVVEEAVSRLFG